jgi:nucleoside-diphosphate-sugar epimerase
VGNFVVSNKKLRKLGWTPKIDLKTGIQNTIEYFESSKND